MSNAISSVLIDLAAEWGVQELVGLSDEQLETVAIRLMVETQDRPTARYLRKIAVEVRAEGERVSAPGSAEAALQTPSAHRPRYLATERTTRARLDREAAAKTRLARQFLGENKRTGLYIVPRRPEVLEPTAVHPACKSAHAEGATPCARCAPLLHPAVCECDVCDEWWAAIDE